MSTELENPRPIVGVLAQEVAYKLEQVYGQGLYKSFIAASYVKFLEGSGARVVPIMIGKDRSYYEDILKKVNGVLFPGGATWFDKPNGYADAGEHIINLAREYNEKGDYFPIWGTCLGMELLIYLWLDRKEEHFRTDCKDHNQASRLTFKTDFRSSKLFSKFPEDVITILSTQNVTFNFHRFCVTEKILLEQNLQKDWTALSLSNDVEGVTYISSMEANRFPFYGVQFHPEKPIYEWIPGKNIPHSFDAIKANRYFADFFVQECRKNHHCFEDVDKERRSLIYNFPLTHTGGKKDVQYEQCYLFN